VRGRVLFVGVVRVALEDERSGDCDGDEGGEGELGMKKAFVVRMKEVEDGMRGSVSPVHMFTSHRTRCVT
jgi:hypothetical protein